MFNTGRKETQYTLMNVAFNFNYFNSFSFTCYNDAELFSMYSMRF